MSLALCSWDPLRSWPVLTEAAGGSDGAYPAGDPIVGQPLPCSPCHQPGTRGPPYDRRQPHRLRAVQLGPGTPMGRSLMSPRTQVSSPALSSRSCSEPGASQPPAEGGGGQGVTAKSSTPSGGAQSTPAPGKRDEMWLSWPPARRPLDESQASGSPAPWCGLGLEPAAPGSRPCESMLCNKDTFPVPQAPFSGGQLRKHYRFIKDVAPS